MKMIVKYIRKVVRHKWFVFVEACKLGVPWLGITHDMSKFRLREMLPYAKYFNGEYLSAVMVMEYPGYKGPVQETVDAAFDVAWNEHQKCNRHHWQYWLLVNDNSEPQVKTLPMPEKYVREMVADWIGAGKAYGNTDTLGWYKENKDKQVMHTATRSRVEELIGYEES